MKKENIAFGLVLLAQLGAFQAHAVDSQVSWKNDPPEVKIGSNCGSDSKCLARLNKAIGFQLGRYQECERLNSMVCDVMITDKRDEIRCDVTKFVSVIIKDGCEPQPTKNGCSQQTNTIVIGFTRELPSWAGMVQIPFVESETGYKYSCE